ncbi:MAG: hypothetical protein JW990_03900 [Thermoleophilia bacterium]|nr:hypothetical protein [Thermoleophilia bacterium]
MSLRWACTDLLAPLTDGAHSFTARVTNAIGVVSDSSAPVTYILDTVVPLISVTKPTVASQGSSVKVDVSTPDFAATVADEGSGIREVTFQVSLDQTDPSWQTASVDTPPIQGPTLTPPCGLRSGRSVKV